MSATLQQSAHPSPQRNRVSLAALLFGTCAAPIFWLGQMMLGYGVTAQACYPGDHPQAIASASALEAALLGFNVVAILASAAGGIVAWFCFAKARRDRQSGPAAAAGRIRFLALWGLFSSLWFFGAILFGTIASMTVPPCVS